MIAAETEYVVAERASPIGSRASSAPRRDPSWPQRASTARTRASVAAGAPPRPRRSVWAPEGRARPTPRSPRRIILSDTSGRPWRIGQVDFALGVHGVLATDDLRGGLDADGGRLEVRHGARGRGRRGRRPRLGQGPAVPAALVRGLAAFVPETDDPAALRGRDLVRSGPDDWFGYGRVEAVRAALVSSQARPMRMPSASRRRREAIPRASRRSGGGPRRTSKGSTRARRPRTAVGHPERWPPLRARAADGQARGCACVRVVARDSTDRSS